MANLGQSLKDAVKTVDAWLTRRAPWHHLASGSSQSVSMYCVYRNRNSAVVAELISGLPTGSQVALHRLDEADCPELSGFTVASGPGARMPLLQALINAQPPRNEPVLIVDDDVAFAPGGLIRFLELAGIGGFDICQPAHDVGSVTSYRLNRFRPFTTARRTRFVEVGPVVYLSVAAQEWAVPFPQDAQMGWGVDVWWTRLAVDHGLTQGVIDAVPMRHLGEVGVEYAQPEEREICQKLYAASGYSGVREVLEELPPRWRPWQRRPPWAS